MVSGSSNVHITYINILQYFGSSPQNMLWLVSTEQPFTQDVWVPKVTRVWIALCFITLIRVHNPRGGIPSTWFSDKPGYKLRVSGKTSNRRALWLCFARRMTPQGSPFRRFTTASEFIYPGLSLNKSNWNTAPLRAVQGTEGRIWQWPAGRGQSEASIC